MTKLAKQKGHGGVATRRAKRSTQKRKPGHGSPAVDNTEGGAAQLTVDRDEAEKFLQALDPTATEFTFQTFDDNKFRGDKSLVRILHGTLDKHYAKLVALSKKGAGVYVTVNETDLKGRKAENVKRVRAIYVDLDGAPLEPAKQPRPHITVESSPQRWHAYWRVDKMPLEQFAAAQRKQIKRLNGDKSITDLPHVLRLPGFMHQKGKPFRTRIVDVWNGKPYSAEKFINHEVESKPNKIRNLPPADPVEIEAALAVIPSDEYPIWFPVGCALHKGLGDEKGYPLFEQWSRKSEKFDARQCAKKWKECADVDGYNVETIFWHANEADPNWRTEQATQSDEPIAATPFVWVDPAKVPKRQWLYKPHYLRQFASATLSTGGVGKSSLIIVEALAMVTGRPLLGITPVKKLRVWYFNGEDPTEELQRRFAAAALKHEITKDEIGNRLFVDSGRTMPVVLAEESRHGTKIVEPVVDQLIATIKANQIDVVIIDPFISTHRVPENDNTAIERVTKTWSHLAEVTNCAIMLAHHTRKNQGNNANASVDDGRGASALLAAVRVARTLNTMREKEANVAGINESERRSYYRSDIGKTNLTRQAEAADWYRLESVDLGNTRMDEPDTVGVVTAWEYPIFEVPEITKDVTQAAMAAVGAGGRWRLNPQSKTDPWVGIPIAEALKVDPDRHKKWLAHLIDQWLSAGLLRRVKAVDPHTRKPREFIERAT